MANPQATLSALFQEIARHVDGRLLVRQALPADAAKIRFENGVAVLSLGKAALPMWKGLADAIGPLTPVTGLLIAPGKLYPEGPPPLPTGFRFLPSDHPTPGARSVVAARAAREFVAALDASQDLLVLLSGGGSSLMALPASDLSLADKTAALTELARAGASISELNTVRKHLSAVKGGRLGLATRARTTVLALSDVIGNDLATIASGPFSPDPTTFAEANALLTRLSPGAPAAVSAWLARGSAGLESETPKPGDPQLDHVTHILVAGPDRVPNEARRAIVAAGFRPGLLSRNTELSVSTLAGAYGARARHEASCGGADRVLVGNGEPTIVVTGEGRGGRATHLALMMAKEISALPGVAFLAAGTDDRDGNTDCSGALVDNTTWTRAVAAGLDPDRALRLCDSERPLAALGCLVHGPGTSNLLDVHLLAIHRDTP